MVAEMAHVLAEQSGRDRRDVASVGIGVPGLVEGSGVLRFAPNLAGMNGLDVAGVVTAELGRGGSAPVVRVANDATCAVVGEQRRGVAAGRRHVVMVTLGTGIGGGIVVDGEPVVGHRGFAGELGHMIVDRDGPACPCGQRGCWERFASGTALGRLGMEAAQRGAADRLVEMAGGDPGAVAGEHVTAAAAAGDAEAGAVVGEWAAWVALGLVSLTAVFDPEIFVLGGGVAGAGEVVLGPVRRALALHLAAGGLAPGPEVAVAALGVRAGAVGAALLAETGG